MYKPNLKDAKEWSGTYEKWSFVMNLCTDANENVSLTDRPSATERRVEQVEKAFSNLLVNVPSTEPEDDSDGRGDWEYEVQKQKRMEEEL